MGSQCIEWGSGVSVLSGVVGTQCIEWGSGDTVY